MNPKKPFKQRRIGKLLFLSGIMSVVVGLLLFSIASVLLLQSVGLSILDLYLHLKSDSIQQHNGRINILLLGIGGKQHEGSDLTDTIQIISLSTNRAQRSIILPIPRDLWSDTLRDRINTAYYYGNVQGRTGGGIGFTKEIIKEITGIPVHYTLLIDFEAFQEAINVLGGVSVNVTTPFIDNQFPIAGKENDTCNGDPLFRCRYQTINFESGNQIMDGERALQYVRSRHASGDEGTDFARARRQEELIEAVLSKLKNPIDWYSAERVSKLYYILLNRIITDVQTDDILQFIRLFLQNRNVLSFQKVSLESQLIHPEERLYEGKYVLIPINSSEALRAYIEASFSATTNHF